MKLPELIIGYDPDGTPSIAICSACGKPIHEGIGKLTHWEDIITTFASQFQAHLKKKHPKPPLS